jgi:hypothetical protein
MASEGSVSGVTEVAVMRVSAVFIEWNRRGAVAPPDAGSERGQRQDGHRHAEVADHS